jgi:hypothetical protein
MAWLRNNSNASKTRNTEPDWNENTIIYLSIAYQLNNWNQTVNFKHSTCHRQSVHVIFVVFFRFYPLLIDRLFPTGSSCTFHRPSPVRNVFHLRNMLNFTFAPNFRKAIIWKWHIQRTGQTRPIHQLWYERPNCAASVGLQSVEEILSLFQIQIEMENNEHFVFKQCIDWDNDLYWIAKEKDQ